MANALTALQTTVLRGIVQNEYTMRNGSIPKEGYVFQAGDFDVWSADLDATREPDMPTGKRLSGVVSTLAQAGYVRSSGESVSLTEAGWDAIKATFGR